MIYNDRVVLFIESKEADLLDDNIVETPTQPVPCMRSNLTNNEQMGLYGKYELGSFKLHLQGVHKGFSHIEYEGGRRMIKGTKVFRNSTVIYV